MKLQITIDGKIYAADVEILDEKESADEPDYPPYQPPSPIPQTMSIPGVRAQAAGSDGYAENEKVCRSPVMGLVIRVHVEPGQTVGEGELMVVLEAMKMETNVTAPRAGTVKSVLVAPGASVKLHQIVVEFE